jgi:hypothetical protein
MEGEVADTAGMGSRDHQAWAADNMIKRLRRGLDHYRGFVEGYQQALSDAREEYVEPRRAEGRPDHITMQRDDAFENDSRPRPDDAILAALRLMPRDEARLDLFNTIFHEFCQHCGTPHDPLGQPCQCSNDE